MKPALINQVEHIVVLMFENRSFDYMLGALPNVNGVGGIVTTGSASSSSISLTVAPPTGIAAGQLVTGSGIGPGTTVSNVDGTTVTLSTAPTATLSSAPLVFTGWGSSTASSGSVSLDVVPMSNQSAFPLGIAVGQIVSGSGIPPFTCVTAAVENGGNWSVTLSQSTTATLSATPVLFTGWGTGSTSSSGPNAITVAPLPGVAQGQFVSGPGIAPNTFVSAFDSSSNIATLSVATTDELSYATVAFFPATTGTGNSGGSVLAVASAAGIQAGQLVTGTGIAPLTYVTAVDSAGNTVTLSQPTTGTLSSTPVVFQNFNLSDPTVASGPAYVQTPIPVGPEVGFFPNHGFSDMIKQMFGPNASGFQNGAPYPSPLPPPPTTPSNQCGYVKNYNPPPPQVPEAVMNYFAANQLQVFHMLAQNFVMCDNWFCDVPAFTLPNRLFMHAATAQGILNYEMPTTVPAITAKTIFAQIDSQLGLANPDQNWKMYHFLFDERDTDYFVYTQGDPRAESFAVTDFFTDAYNGTLPFYSFLMPVLNSAPPPQCNSMHPDADVRYGENYLAAVYNSLFGMKPNSQEGEPPQPANPDWDKTLLIVTFDENGGIYDHVTPPTTVAPGDGFDGSVYGQKITFDFTSLGVRIPVLLISPWLVAGVDHTQYQNTSVLRFIQDWLVADQASLNPNLPTPPPLALTQRDLNATSIAEAFTQFCLSTPRGLTQLPPAIGYPGYDWNYQLPPCGATYDGGYPSIFMTPSRDQIELAKQYLTFLPGHPDSGKPITRDFATYADLIEYREERRKAAKKAKA